LALGTIIFVVSFHFQSSITKKVIPREDGEQKIFLRAKYWMVPGPFALIPVRPKSGFVRPDNYNYVGY